VVGVQKLVPQATVVSSEYVGTTEAVEQVEIRPRVSGLLEQRLATEGQRVRKGQPLFRIDRQPFIDAEQQARAALAQAEASAGQAERDYQRAQSLAASDALSQQELDATLTRRDSGVAAVQAARAALSTAQLNLGYTVVSSPIDGLLGRAQLKEGALATAYTSLLATVYSTDPIYVNFALSEQDLSRLQQQSGRPLDPRDPNPLPVKLLRPDGSVYPQPAEIDFVDPAVDPQTGTLSVRLRVQNPDNGLRSGQFVRVSVGTQTLPAAILVPQRAVQDLQGKRYVWIVDGENKAQQRDLTMGPQIGADWLVLKGLSGGETVIVDGAQRIKAGTVVTPQSPESATAPAAGGKP
jgi:membrane fusion protein (multidrug efflux system)